MSPSLALRRGLLALVVLALAALPGSAQKLGGPDTKKKGAPAAAPSAPAPAKPPTAAPGDKARPLAPNLRGAPSADDENEGGESDPFDPKALLARGKSVPANAAATALHLASHPKRDELAKWLVDSLRGREIDVALLGGHRYMINSCLGIKASVGKFKLKLDNPSVRFENSGIVVTFSIDHVSLSALKIRMRPNPNPLELCKFGKKFEVGGSMEDVRLTLRLDPLYDLERCRIGLPGDMNPEVRIGNLNLKPLQNDLDRMAKNMVEDALTFALQTQSDGVFSAFGDLVFSAIDQFLEADCPTRPGDTGRAITDVGRTLGGLGGKVTGGGSAPKAGGSAPKSGGTAPAGDAPAPSSGGDYDVAALLERIEALEARIAELEACGTSAPTDVADLLQQLLAQSGELDSAEAASPLVQGLIAQVLAAVLERSGRDDSRAWLGDLAKVMEELETGGAPEAATPAPSSASSAPWHSIANPTLTGRMGRIVVRFPNKELAASTHIAVYRDGKKVTDKYGEAEWEFLPGLNEVRVTNVPISGCEVRTGCDTVVSVGLLQVELDESTWFGIFQKGKPQKLFDTYGSAVVGLPIGEYEVEIQGQREAVSIQDGKVTRF